MRQGEFLSLAVNGLIRSYGAWAWFLFDRCAKNPRHAQETLLIDILRKNRTTSFGNAHGFDSIGSEKEYRRHVPISDYENFRPSVDQILVGRKSVLTTDDPVRFNLTSGTTGQPKHIPITREGQNQEIRLISQWYYKALKDHPKFLDNDRAAIVGAAVDGVTLTAIPYGSASGMIFQRIPPFIRRRYAVPDAVFEVKDYDDRYFLVARCALAKDISFLLTPNPGTFVRLAAVMAKHAEDMVRAIHDGRSGGRIDHGTKGPFLFKPDPKRAASLERILARTGTLRPREVWPTLQLTACWLGGCAGAQAHKLAADYGEVPIRDCGYMASEAHITLPFQDHSPSGALTIQTNYYEFIPEEHHGDKTPPVLSCHELEQGKRYAILLTTRSGLYRYDLNDIVEVTGFYHQTPVLAFVRKGRDMTNITGEKIHANHFLTVMEDVRRTFGIDIEQFRAVPDLERGRYRLLIETNNDLSENVVKDQILVFIDQALSKVNIEYGQKRASKRLHSPLISLMRRGWSEEERRRFQNSGKNDIQFKWRVICSEMRPEDDAAIVKTFEKGEPHDRSSHSGSVRPF